MADPETFYQVMRRQGITRRSFLKFCSLTTAGLELGPAYVDKIAHALETKPRTPVIGLYGGGLSKRCSPQPCSSEITRRGWP